MYSSNDIIKKQLVTPTIHNGTWGFNFSFDVWNTFSKKSRTNEREREREREREKEREGRRRREKCYYVSYGTLI